MSFPNQKKPQAKQENLAIIQTAMILGLLMFLGFAYMMLKLMEF